jgi:hypothetical protein
MNNENQIVINTVDAKELVDLLRPMIKEELTSLKLEQEERMISPAEACKVFEPSITKATLNSWTKKGWLREYRLGGRVFYKKSEILNSAKSIKKYRTVYDIPFKIPL